VRFLGVDLAWKDGNPSGVSLLGGQRFPLHLREVPHTLPRHADVLGWIARHVAHHRASVGIDAPLLGLGHGRRECENEIARNFGSFDASTHSTPSYPGLEEFAHELTAAHGINAMGPGVEPAAGRPAIREVYPNAFQVLLFDLKRGMKIVKYKKRRFGPNANWASEGLGPFVRRTIQVVGGRYVVNSDPAWLTLVAERPKHGMSGAQLKSIEDRWDAVLCAVAVASEFLAPGSMRFYPEGPTAWRRGYILAPVLPAER
jgi:predicted RNase H-like nuclease